MYKYDASVEIGACRIELYKEGGQCVYARIINIGWVVASGTQDNSEWKDFWIDEETKTCLKAAEFLSSIIEST